MKFTTQFMFRTTQEQLDNIKALAEFYGQTASGIIRAAVDDFVVEQRLATAEGCKLLREKQKRKEASQYGKEVRDK